MNFPPFHSYAEGHVGAGAVEGGDGAAAVNTDTQAGAVVAELMEELALTVGGDSFAGESAVAVAAAVVAVGTHWSRTRRRLRRLELPLQKSAP